MLTTLPYYDYGAVFCIIVIAEPTYVLANKKYKVNAIIDNQKLDVYKQHKQIKGTAKDWPIMQINPFAQRDFLSSLSDNHPDRIDAINPHPERMAAFTSAYSDLKVA